MTFVTHYWPGITWETVWLLPFYVWRLYAEATDHLKAEAEAAQNRR